MNGHLGLGGKPEEGVVQFLVVDVDLAELGSNLLTHLGLQVLRFFLGTQRQAELLHTCPGSTATSATIK